MFVVTFSLKIRFNFEVLHQEKGSDLVERRLHVILNSICRQVYVLLSKRGVFNKSAGPDEWTNVLVGLRVLQEALRPHGQCSGSVLQPGPSELAFLHRAASFSLGRTPRSLGQSAALGETRWSPPQPGQLPLAPQELQRYLWSKISALFLRAGCVQIWSFMEPNQGQSFANLKMKL